MNRVDIRTVSQRRLAAVWHRGDYREIGEAFGKVAAALSAQGNADRIGTMVAVFYDNPDQVRTSELRSLAGYELAPDVEITPPLEEILLAEGRHAVMRHVGPYAGLPDCYHYFFGEWLPASGQVEGGAASFEVYLNSPMDTAPEELVTEIYVPLA